MEEEDALQLDTERRQEHEASCVGLIEMNQILFQRRPHVQREVTSYAPFLYIYVYICVYV
jgi:hypothetical protein